MNRQRPPVKKRQKKRRPPKIEEMLDGGFCMEIRDWRDMRDFMSIAYPARSRK